MSLFQKTTLTGQKALLAKECHQLIEHLCRKNKHQMKPREYRAIADLVIACAPANFLVFGLGRDTPLWKMANPGGQTVFLENVQEWIDISHTNDPSTLVYKVSYTTKRTEWNTIQDDLSKLTMQLPPDVTSQKWDIILVDSPGGAFDTDPGRMQSIYTAAQLKPNHIFLHDCNRPVEKFYFKKFISSTPKKIRKLWYTQFKAN
jgi:uncharacterized protein (TIGR01627 family)